jgi:hypothetical protein
MNNGVAVSADQNQQEILRLRCQKSEQGEPAKRPLLSIRFYNGEFFLAVRTSLPPESLGLTLHETVWQVDPELPVNDVRTVETWSPIAHPAPSYPPLLRGHLEGSEAAGVTKNSSRQVTFVIVMDT